MTLPKTESRTPVVYLIDDDPNDIMIIRRLCESVGLGVQCHDCPHDFLRELDPDPHGCIVADLLMPKMTGLQLHEELKKSGSELPIIVVTGHADASTCRTALHNGVFDFVEKSFNPHDLLVVIRRAINENARMKQERSLRESYLQQLTVLSPRERQVMQLLSNGRTLKEIAAEFGISVQTASKHRSKLFEKLGVSNEVELLRLLFRIDSSNGLDEPAVPPVTPALEFSPPGLAPAAESD